MSLLLKALKQAEAANAESSNAADGYGRVEGDLELEPALPGAAKAREWVEPPGLLFGKSGAAPERERPLLSRLPHLSLVPLTALLAGLVAAAYGVYLYFALQPAAPAPPPPAVDESAYLIPSAASRPAVPAVPTAPETAAPPEPRKAPPPAPRLAPPPASGGPASPAPPTPAARPAAPTAPSAPSPAPSPAVRFRPDAQSSLLTEAHAAYQRGAIDESLRLYTRAANAAPSVDALLGLAAIAGVQKREADAQRLYQRVLDLDPRNATAQAALLDLLGSTDDGAAESRLKLLLEREPSPHLYQTLGNLYAGQNRWGDAQAAYFEAFRGAANNADYAYNLAVSLDQLHQYPAALSYYTKALALGGAHRFDRAQAEARVQQLQRMR
ncbi:hypothetical protein containing TPR repeat [Thiobacillus denitrificans ATCC 25259]|uniref:Tetratricopeptide repeat protein n=1 Tax=Thiobacillus denitrificans (strain ATCC 25259 / T1) TaxID=292415 RepID=Q3SLB4_THIDA|nr:hypothetical protein [Thiobacillus denitrificans]AAZ96501.1 hypothetical protein containing TPR repeat [Thiobacillus denitrificans ATCC 25259]